MWISRFSSLLSAVAMFLYPPTKVLKILQSLGNQEKQQNSSLIGMEKLNKVGYFLTVSQNNSRRLWRSQRRKFSSVPAGAASLPAAVFLAGKCRNLGRDSISRCRKIGESFEICRKILPAENFRQPQPSRVF